MQRAGLQGAGIFSLPLSQLFFFDLLLVFVFFPPRLIFVFFLIPPCVRLQGRVLESNWGWNQTLLKIENEKISSKKKK